MEKAAKKARLSAEVIFRQKGNEKQYRFNEVVQDKFSSVAIRIDEAATSAAAWTSSGSSASTLSAALRSASAGVLSALKQAREAVEEGTEVVKNRQKAIRITDRSELGWAVVNEYGEDELAGDSDDEKRIARAVATAERKAAQLKKSGRGGYVQNRPAKAPVRALRQPDFRVLGHFGQLVRVLRVERLDTYDAVVRRTCYHGRIL